MNRNTNLSTMSYYDPCLDEDVLDDLLNDYEPEDGHVPPPAPEILEEETSSRTIRLLNLAGETRAEVERSEDGSITVEEIESQLREQFGALEVVGAHFLDGDQRLTDLVPAGVCELHWITDRLGPILEKYAQPMAQLEAWERAALAELDGSDTESGLYDEDTVSFHGQDSFSRRYLVKLHFLFTQYRGLNDYKRFVLLALPRLTEILRFRVSRNQLWFYSGRNHDRTPQGVAIPESMMPKHFKLGPRHCFRLYCSERLRNDADIALIVVTTVVKQNVDLIQDLSERLRDDRQIALLAVKECPTAIKFVSERLRTEFQAGVALMFPPRRRAKVEDEQAEKCCCPRRRRR